LSAPTGGRLVSVPLGDGAMITTVETYDDRVVLHVRSTTQAEPKHVLATYIWSVTDDRGTPYKWLGGGGGGGPTADWLFTTICWEPGPPPAATELQVVVPDAENLQGARATIPLPIRD